MSCKKNTSEDENTNKSDLLPKKLTIEDAKSYYGYLQAKYGNYDSTEISGKIEKNYKRIDFSHAYIGENETTFFVEAPIHYTRREVVFKSNLSIEKDTINRMLLNSIDRFVVYKDKISGMISAKIVTVIPSVNFLNSGNKNLYKNHYQSVIKEFSGYVSNRSWKGRFLSTQSYNLEDKIHGKVSKVEKVDDITCQWETIYRGYTWCEDPDPDGGGVNCDYVIISYEANVCDIAPPVFHDHSAILPSQNDSYWQGFPDPYMDPANSCPLLTPRIAESPVLYVGLKRSSISVTFYDACFCQGYSWIILEEVNSGTEYSFPVINQNFLMAGCTTLWESNVQIPNNIPSGEYFVKVNLDGDIFYHQLEQNGAIVKRWKHSLF